MITKTNNPNYQFLGAQILSQKIERDSSDLSTDELNSLKEFLFRQLGNSQFNLPTLRKIATAGSIVAIVLYLDHWPGFLKDLVTFMTPSVHTVKVGLMVLDSLA